MRVSSFGELRLRDRQLNGLRHLADSRSYICLLTCQEGEGRHCQEPGECIYMEQMYGIPTPMHAASPPPLPKSPSKPRPRPGKPPPVLKASLAPLKLPDIKKSH